MNRSCPTCRKPVFPDEDSCPYCGALLGNQGGAAEDGEATLVAARPVSTGPARSGVPSAPIGPAATARTATAARPKSAHGAKTRALEVDRAPLAVRRGGQSGPSNAVLVMVVGLVVMLLGFYLVKRLSETKQINPADLDVTERSTKVEDARSLKYILINDRLAAGDIRLVLLTKTQLSTSECEGIRDQIGQLLNSPDTAGTVSGQFSSPARYKSWRDLGSNVTLVIKSDQNEPKGYFEQTFKIK